MPKNDRISKVVVLGSGPIVIGQAAEFDYAGTQACRALKEEGIQVVLINSNPATIMTDNIMADKIYIEPLTQTIVKRVIEKERPDCLLATMGGQTGLTLAMQLAKEGFLDRQNVALIGANPDTIDRAEDRQLFKDTMQKIGQPVIPSAIAHSVEQALGFAGEIGYPVIVRPAFTLGGTGGGIASTPEQLAEICANGLRLSPIGQALIEKSVAGWKEIEFEVMRDSIGNVIAICSMENFDPVGVHTGDSIVVAPAVTLSDKEYQMLRSAALEIIQELGVVGGCNCQFALDPDSFDYAVIEVNPRVSRSSALASKATGYPIAKVAAKLALGYTLDEIKNAVTGKTCACFEPTLDYVVVKLPKWPFDKFTYAQRKLGTQMKATGEVMSIGLSFEEALMKAVRGAEISMSSLSHPRYRALTDEDLWAGVCACTDERLFMLYEALRRDISPDRLFKQTKVDRWFLNKLANLVAYERSLSGGLDDEKYLRGKKLGYPDDVIREISGCEIQNPRLPVYKMVDTCAAEFSAQTPYFYASYDSQNEAAEFVKTRPDDRKTVIVFGSGPIRIGQGIEFDYASVHCVRALRKAGYDTVIVNNNPETVSTDFDTADRLYFEPLANEDVRGVIGTEKPYGVVAAFGGQTAIKLTPYLSQIGVNILGTSAESIDIAENRKRFDALLETLNILRPQGLTALNLEEALFAAEKIGYPVLMRPSYVLGGQNMIIAFNDEDIREYMEIILSRNGDNPVLIDKYLMGTELEVDAICDGKDILIPGIMEHIERAGIHSGDSIAVYPAWNCSDEMTERIVECSRALALALGTKGLVNIQYLIYNQQLYVIEVNPRSSRTIPYISKVTGVPMAELATRAMLGEELARMGFGTGLYRMAPYAAVKVPVFSFEKLIGVDTHLGPEMKSTGEALGIANTAEEALFKGLIAAGYNLNRSGGVLITVRDADKPEVYDVAKKFYDLGFSLYATRGTANVLRRAELRVQTVDKIHQSATNTQTLIESGKISYVISTSSKGRIPTRDSVKLRRCAVERSIPCLTSIDTAHAIADSLKSRYSEGSIELVDINHMRSERMKLAFTKMQGCGNDYIYFNCYEQKINNPGGLSVRLADRHFGIGGDGVVLICPSDIADAKMRMFNLDGSEGKMCGNAIRCVGKYLYERGIVHDEEMSIETLSGVKKLKLFVRQGKVHSVQVDMGRAEFDPRLIPVEAQGEKIIGQPMVIGGEEYAVTCVSMGNPHCVVFCDSVDDLDIDRIGPQFEHDKHFPERVNAEFVKPLARNILKMRVWERGSGETWACGTGACAAAAAAVENGLCDKGADILVKLKGGDLTIRYTDETVMMTGNAQIVFEGVVEI